jgi:hypothetical protein
MNLPTSGTNVFEDPAAAVSDTDIPAVILEASRESVSSLGEIGEPDSGYIQSRLLSITVTGVAKSIAQRDQSAVEIEEAILNSGVGKNRKLESTDFDDSGEGNARLWVCSLSFEIQYLTENSYPRIVLR